MGYDKEKIRQIRGLILFVAGIVLLLLYSGNVLKGLGVLLDILVPFLAGGAIAFVLNIPMRAIEEKLLGRWKGKWANRIKRPLCLFLSIVLIVAILAFVIIMVVPKLQETVVLLGVQVPVFAKELLAKLEEMASSDPALLEKLNELEKVKIDWNALFDKAGGFLATGMGSVLNSAVVVASSIIGGVVNAFIAIVFAIYILAQKEKLSDQGHRILSAYLPAGVCSEVERVLSLLYRNFSNFISGQCLEAVILGTMFVVAMTILRFPYALLIGVLIAFLALIPIVGAFVGCFLGALLLLMNDPVQAVGFVVLFLVLQQIEGNLIYPHVVGGSVGLPSLWVLVAVSVGGSLFGIVGMLCFIPLVSTGYTLLRENVNARNQKKRASEKRETASEKKEPAAKGKEITSEKREPASEKKAAPQGGRRSRGRK